MLCVLLMLVVLPKPATVSIFAEPETISSNTKLPPLQNVQNGPKGEIGTWGSIFIPVSVVKKVHFLTKLLVWSNQPII